MTNFSDDDVLAIAVPQLQYDEGCKLTAYPDPLSGGEPWTVGYGSTGDDIQEGTTWTLADALARLKCDANDRIAGLDAKVPWWRGMTPARGAVLINMSYQLGLAGLLDFHITLAVMEQGDYAAASKGMLQSRWAEQTSERAERLAKQITSGVKEYP